MGTPDSSSSAASRTSSRRSSRSSGAARAADADERLPASTSDASPALFNDGAPACLSPTGIAASPIPVAATAATPGTRHGPNGSRQSSPHRAQVEAPVCRGAGASCRAAFATPCISPNRPTPTQRRDAAVVQERQRRVEHREEVRRVAAQRVDRALIAAGLAGCVGSNDTVSAQRKAEVARQVKRKVEDMLRTVR